MEYYYCDIVTKRIWLLSYVPYLALSLAYSENKPAPVWEPASEELRPLTE